MSKSTIAILGFVWFGVFMYSFYTGEKENKAKHEELARMKGAQ